MNKPITLSVFFPAYNEEENIQTTVEKTVRVVEESPYVRDYEIIIVNDGSRDHTAAVSERLMKKYSHVRLVNHEGNKGYGEALRTGIHAATMEYVFFTDADLQFDILELQNLLLHIPHNDVVVGYRAPRRDSTMRLLNAWGWNKLNRLFFGLRITDIDCAFKLFKRDKVQSLPLKSRGAMISAETLVRLDRAGARIKEIPVTHHPRAAGVATGAKLSVIFRAFKEMVMLYGGDLGNVTHKEVFRFMIVGAINTTLDLSAYLLLTRGVALFAGEPVAAKFFSFLLGTISSLFLNRYWTFGLTGALTLGEITRFYATVSASLVLNIALMYTFVHILGLYDLVALALTTGLTLALNYTLSKLWVFKKPQLAHP